VGNFCKGFITLACINQFARGDSIDHLGGLLTTNSPFVLYLENPPWVKEIQFKQGHFFEIGKTPDQIDRTQWADMEMRGAIQPSGFYLETLTASPPGFGPPPLPGRRTLGGSSIDYFWTAFYSGSSNNVPHVLTWFPQRPEAGASPSNYPQETVKNYFNILETIRFLGLPVLQTNSLRLGDMNQFNTVKNDGSLVAGNILKAINGKPLILNYTIDSDPSSLFQVIYYYTNGQDLPVGFDLIAPQKSNFYTPPKQTGLNEWNMVWIQAPRMDTRPRLSFLICTYLK
jgi:hypothetical protein